MAGSSLLTLIDDIATLLDDVATMTKIAARKTAGVVGDDLALNAQQVTGIAAERELPVVWAVARGSAVNKAILVPAALAISALLPWAVIPLLMLGGGFLCYEGFEKVWHKLAHRHDPEDEAARAARLQALRDQQQDMVAWEKTRIRGAIRTDFILSAEIIAIVLGVVAQEEFMTRLGVLVAVSILITVGVYGLVAAIVKLDDAGRHLSLRGGLQARLGDGILWAAPYLMKALGIVGTAAMFLVGGGILAHGIAPLEHLLEELAAPAGGFAGLVMAAGQGLVGIIAGALLVLLVSGARLVLPARAGAAGE